jgi:hypothetical protein
MRREYLVLFLLFVYGTILRLYFGLYRPTGDLQFYTLLEQSQSTLIGLGKEIRFYPLLVFDSPFIRTLVLAVATSLLNVTALTLAVKRADQRLSLFILSIVVLNWYFAQIDMHLVRQQLAIYFFMILFMIRGVQLLQLVLAVLSVFYHEVALLLIVSWLTLLLVSNLFSFSLRVPLFIASIFSIPIMYIQGAGLGALFLAYNIIGFYFVKSDSDGVSIGDVIYLSILAVFLLNSLGYLTPVNFTRVVGVLVSISLFRLMFDGRFQISQRLIKMLGLVFTLSLYGIMSSA